MASSGIQPSNSSLSNVKEGFADQKPIFPIINSTPPSPLQDSLLNSPFTLVSGDAIKHFQPHQEIDPALQRDNVVYKFQDSHFAPPILTEAGFSLLSNINGSGFLPSTFQSFESGNHQPFENFLVSKATRESHDGLGNTHHELSSFQATKEDRTTNTKKAKAKVAFVDPMHPTAHLKHVAVFCCQIPSCQHQPKKEYEVTMLDFIKFSAKPTIGTPLYGGRKESLNIPQANNPDIRIPMLLVTGARVYKVHKMKEPAAVRMFVRDSTNEKKPYMEILAGGACDQMGWASELRDMVASPGKTSTWKCKSHGETWSVSFLDRPFDQVDGEEGTTTPVMGTGYDSGYVSSSSRARASSRASKSGFGGQNLSPGIESMDKEASSAGMDEGQQNSAQGDSQDSDTLDGDITITNDICDANYIDQIQEQALEDLDIDDASGAMYGMDCQNGGDYVDPEDGYIWADDLLHEINMFNEELGNEDMDLDLDLIGGSDII